MIHAMKPNLQQIEKRIRVIKKEIVSIEEMRPGSLTQQYRKSRKDESYGSYWSLSYTFNKKGHTEYIRNELVKDVEMQTQNYKKFRILIDEWIELSIQHAQEKLKISRENLVD
jgi:hypothetical protein